MSALVRPPVVAVLGHVDHGKTSLLDTIRGTHVQESESAGITQNTRAHQIEYKGQKITFIDTPGHEAFSKMRERGAKVTDIVMLVVAADDGVQPQTKESIKFALSEKVPVIVVINKIDLPNNIAKLKQQLATAGILIEEHGGEVIVCETSAVKKIGIDHLLDTILLVSEMSELRKKKVEKGVGTAYILESTTDKHLGPVALSIVKSGTIKPGQYLVQEGGYTKLRDLFSEQMVHQDSASEGDPVVLVGLKNQLEIGNLVTFFDNEDEAEELSKKVEKGEEKLQEDTLATEVADLDMLAQLYSASDTDEEIKYLNVVLKSETKGTLEVVKHEIEKLNDEFVKVKLLEASTGNITENDITKAKIAKGIVIGFKTGISKKLEEFAQKDRVICRVYDVIYDLLDEIGDVLLSMADPTMEEVEIARAKVRKVFILSDKSVVAGSVVEKGTVVKGYKVYVLRDGEKIAEGKITSLKQNKNDVKEVKKGQECGIFIESNPEIQEGDEISCIKIEK